MTQCTAGFETGTNGNTLATTDTGNANAFDVVNIGTDGSTFKYDTAHAHGGTLAAKYVAGSSSGVANIEWTSAGQLGSISTCFGRIYIWVAAFPSFGDQTICIANTGVGRVYDCAINTSGQLKVYGDGALLATSTNTINTNAWTRIEFGIITGATGTAQAKLFQSADSSTATETIGSTSTSVGSGNLSNILIGPQVSGGNGEVTTWADDILAGAATWPGPSGGGGAAANGNFLAFM